MYMNLKYFFMPTRCDAITHRTKAGVFTLLIGMVMPIYSVQRMPALQAESKYW